MVYDASAYIWYCLENTSLSGFWGIEALQLDDENLFSTSSKAYKSCVKAAIILESFLRSMIDVLL